MLKFFSSPETAGKGSFDLTKERWNRRPCLLLRQK